MNGCRKAILHLEDWVGENGKPNAMVHVTTTNKTFLRMALVLKKMGLKNHMFHLALLDPTLANVNPHDLNEDTDPSQELRLRVAVECRYNPWYFFREVMRIPADGGDAIPYKLNRGNLAMMWCFFSNLDFSSTQPRQTGKSVGAVALCCYMMYLRGFNMSFAMLTHNNDIVQANVKRLKDMREGLPSYLVKKTLNDLDNKEGLFYKRLNTKYQTFTAQKDRRAANNVARGYTASFIHWDEIAFMANIDVTFQAASVITSAASENAKRAGQFHGNIFTTTAGDPMSVEGKYVLGILSKAMKFTEKLYDTKDNEEAHRVVEKNSDNKLIDGTFSYLQLGEDHSWFKRKTNNLLPTAIERDYLLHWVSLAEHPILGKQTLARMHGSMKSDPAFIEMFGDYIINWYVPKNKFDNGEYAKRTLVMGMDCSEMIGRDATTCVAVDPIDMSVAFTFRCTESNSSKLAIFIAELLAKYTNILFVPERKSTAIPIIDKVLLVMQSHGQNPFKRIFNRIVDNYHLDEYRHYDMSELARVSDDATRKYLGFMTTGKSRPFLYKQVLFKAAEAGADRLYDRGLITEMSALQARDGRMDHGAGGHDDLVIAYLMACYLIFEGKNLHMYGLDSRQFLQSIRSTNGLDKDPAYVSAQLILRKQIRDLVNSAKRTDDELMRRSILFRLEQLSPKVDTAINIDPLSADSLQRDSFDYRDIKREIESASRTRQVSAGALTRALFSRASNDILERNLPHGIH